MGELVSFIPHDVNGVKVEQRITDGFINGTSMCVAHGKNIVDWFRSERTYNLFKFISEESGIISNMVSHHTSEIVRLSATRYVEIFPTLVFVKLGSPVNGGGVWVHPDLAIDLASFCSPSFAIQVGRWIREWFVTGKNPIQIDSDEEIVLWRQRHDIRVYLKDFLRPELMDAVVAYALKNRLNPIKLCASVHDTINERVQGMKSREIKVLNGLPLGELIRDFFEASPLLTYAAINKLAKNQIEDKKVEPIQAIHNACDMYLGVTYTPKPLKLVENIYSQGLKLREARKIKALDAHHQLEIFPNDKAG